MERNRAGVFLANLLIGAGMFGMNLFMTYFLQVNLHYTPLQAGVAFLPFSVGIIAATTLGPPLVTRFGPKPLMVAGTSLATAGLLWLIRLDTASAYTGEVLPTQILVSVGVGLFFLAGPNVALSGVDPRDAGGRRSPHHQPADRRCTRPRPPQHPLPRRRHRLPHPRTPAGGAASQALQLQGFLHGYRIAFIVAGALMATAVLALAVLVKTPKSPSAEPTTPAPAH